MGKFPFYPQMDSMDCGPACLQMILQHHGRYFPLPWLRSISFISREGVSLKGIGKAAERTGLRSMAVKIPFAGGSEVPCLLNTPMPIVAHWNQNHLVVVHKANKNFVWIADPAAGKHKLPKADFLRGWQSDGDRGIALLLEPTPSFYETEAPPTILDFSAYPSREYGQVEGKLTSLAPVALPDQNGQYLRLATVALPNTLLTSYGKTLPFRYNLSGTARVITAERTLLQRLLDQFLNLTKNT